MYRLVLSIFLLFTPFFLLGQNSNSDAVVGTWLNEQKNTKLEISKSPTGYSGKIIWSADVLESDGLTSKKDAKNPDEKLKQRSLIGAPILNNFIYMNGIWDEGNYYDYKSGKTYDCIIRVKKNKMEIRSYVGITLFGKSSYWEKAD